MGNIFLSVGDFVRYHYVRHHLPVDSGKVLDCGCNNGNFRKYLDECFVYSGIDINVHKDTKDFDFKEMDICDLKFPDNSFDVVISIDVLEHLKNPELAVAEMLRVSKGWVVVHVPNIDQKHILFDNAVLGSHPDHVVEGFTEQQIRVLFKNFKRGNIIPTFNSREALMWDYHYCESNKIDFDIFDFVKPMKHYGWMVIAKK